MRRLGHVQDDEAEVAGLQDERERFDRLIDRTLIQIAAHPGIDDDVTTNPEQLIQRDPGRRRRFDVERVERIDQGDQLPARRRGGERLPQQARPTRRSRADELRQLAAREPARQSRI